MSYDNAVMHAKDPMFFAWHTSVKHLDGDATNMSLDNLEWDLPEDAERTLDAYERYFKVPNVWVSPNGLVYNDESNRMVKAYETTNIRNDRHFMALTFHKLDNKVFRQETMVLQTFEPEIAVRKAYKLDSDVFLRIMHLNGDTLDNHLDNLVWYQSDGHGNYQLMYLNPSQRDPEKFKRNLAIYERRTTKHD